MVSAHDVWAVGYRVVGGVYRPSVQRWDGHRWRLIPFPSVHAGVGVLRGVQIGSDGQPVVVGTRWDAATSSWRGITARRQGSKWYVMDTPAIGTGTELRDLVDPAGWHGPRGGRQRASLAGHGPVPRAAGHHGWRGDRSDTTRRGTDGQRPERATERAPSVTAERRSHRRAELAGRQRHPSPTVSARPTRRPPVIVRDMTKAAGLEKSTSSYGAVRADFNGDGWPDLFIGRHSNPGWLVINDQHGGFVDAPGVSIPRKDRHGCAAGDVNGDRLTDLYCANGAFHGAGLKGNELYIQQPDGTFVDESMAMHSTDPFGRGRLVAMFDLDHDKYADLFLANRPARTDGLPSLDRVLSNERRQWVRRPVSVRLRCLERRRLPASRRP